MTFLAPVFRIINSPGINQNQDLNLKDAIFLRLTVAVKMSVENEVDVSENEGEERNLVIYEDFARYRTHRFLDIDEKKIPTRLSTPKSLNWIGSGVRLQIIPLIISLLTFRDIGQERKFNRQNPIILNPAAQEFIIKKVK